MLNRAAIAQIGFAASIACLWEVTSRTGLIDPDILPSFSKTMVTLWNLLHDGSFLQNLGDTMYRVVLAFAIGLPLALGFGLWIGESARLGRIVSPMLYFALAIPQSVFLPIFVLAFGIGTTQKVIFGVTHIVFVVIVNTAAAVQSVPKGIIVAAQSFGATKMQIYRDIYLPAMLPLILTGIRIGMTFNVIGILLAEMYASRSGIGMLIFRWGESYDVARLTAAVVLVSAIVIGFNELMRAWEHHAGKWQTVGARS